MERIWLNQLIACSSREVSSHFSQPRLMLQNRFWTADRLLLREWPNQYFCPLCYCNLETVAHLFTECQVVRQIWTEISSWVSIPGFHPQRWVPDPGVADWFNELTDSSSSAKSRAHSLTILVYWSIWRERNARLFEAQEKNMSRLVSEIKDEASLWVMAGAKYLSLLVSSPISE
jgi:hypothetical protein